MKLAILTDGLDANLDVMLDGVSDLGYEGLELATGNWSDAPHIDIDHLLESSLAREAYQEKIRSRNLEICALNCSGNQLAPGETGKKHAAVVEKTFRLAECMGIKKIVMMSGLPAGGPNDEYPNWVVSSWPEENLTMLEYQWDVAFKYWETAAKNAKEHGIEKIALENHGCQLVYNCETLFKLRDEVGDIIGMNVDPSHMFWMGGDPIQMLRELGSAVHHIHAKDARIERHISGINGLLDGKHISKNSQRSWNFAAVGHGHDLGWWKEFFTVASMMGYDGEVSLEIEDVSMDVKAVVEKSTQVLKLALPR